MERKAKNGRTIAAEVKSYLVTTKVDIEAGRLNKRGNDGRVFAGINTEKVVPTGTKVCLRFGVKKFDGKYLVYMHSFGWTEVTNLNDMFSSGKKIEEDLLQANYETLTADNKILAFKKYFPDKFENLTKTEKMLMAHLEGKDLDEVTKEIAADKSLKYKIRKDTEKFEKTFIKKLEAAITA